MMHILVVRCKPLTKDHLPLKTAFSGPKGVVVSPRFYCALIGFVINFEGLPFDRV